MKKAIENGSIKRDGDDDSDSSSSSSSEEEKTVPSKAPTEKPTKAKITQKVTSKTRKASKPSTIDCDKDHTVSVQDDYTLSGVLIVKSCHASRFQRKPSRCMNVGSTFGSLITNGAYKIGIRTTFKVNIVKTLGNKEQTEFHYQCPCEKAYQPAIIQQLKEACKNKNLTSIVTSENQPDDSDSSSESDMDSTY